MITQPEMNSCRLLKFLLPVIVITGCAGSGPRTINLMPAPAVFANRVIDILPKDQPPLFHGDFSVLYATDRRPAEDPDQRPFYLNEAGFVVRLGQARVQTSAQVGWAEARRISLSTERTRNYPLLIHSVDEKSILDSTRPLLTKTLAISTPEDQTGEEFAKLIDQRLTASGVKHVYIYVHGFRVIFDDPVLIAAELWHFLGYRGAFVAYAWPSTPRALA